EIYSKPWNTPARRFLRVGFSKVWKNINTGFQGLESGATEKAEHGTAGSFTGVSGHAGFVERPF
ncbi:MAG: hypothetical protein NTY53_13305, partial [Kiritimatiellaeota bacterium]|nr:hypothetical protein [Kiritimatiellota bacterium]